MSLRYPFKLAALSLALLAGQSAIAAELADTIWTGGPILTINDVKPKAEAVAVRDGKILAVGTLSELKAHQGKTPRPSTCRAKPCCPALSMPTGMPS
ncbi:imidazolonepropionase-like domain-containing protein [Neopusillimonas aromaticivorans]|uniref:imidazolonepropionase-like domain-containing protein n=1 Tax=Neopusillimonas aromaticivorans TaxID=2979868 RepID=UPI00259869F5|nr:hypothetical protein [Neopusillimonas aromaticivorans]WJJ94460.1 hypothetical protein N7E01_05660 [Neopusillimonas aromaticivorans]